MMKKYLNSDPLPWLTDRADPAVTYLAGKEFSAFSSEETLYSELESSQLTSFFKKTSRDNILGDMKNIDLVNRGTVWYFLWAVECGYDIRTPFIRKTADFLIMNTQARDGGFSLMLKPEQSLSCRTGDIIRALIKSGINDEKTASGLEWIVCHQRADGGWLHCPFNGICSVMKMILFKRHGNGIARDNDPDVPSCPVATLSCLRALSVADKSLYKNSIGTAMGFFLNHPVLSVNEKTLSCGLQLKPLRLGYPVMSQFDILTFLIERSGNRFWDNSICDRLFNMIIKKQSAKGTWELENNGRGMILAGRGENRFVTLNVLRLLKNIDLLEDIS